MKSLFFSLCLLISSIAESPNPDEVLTGDWPLDSNASSNNPTGIVEHYSGCSICESIFIILGEDEDDFAIKVNGQIAANEIRVRSVDQWPDYVFNPDYKLEKLEDVEQHIKEERHLPGVPSAQIVEESGYEFSQMDKILMKKIEELSLYVIQHNSKLDKIKKAQ